MEWTVCLDTGVENKGNTGKQNEQQVSEGLLYMSWVPGTDI